MLQCCLLILPFHPLFIHPWLWSFLDKCKFKRYWHFSVSGTMFSTEKATVIMMKILPSGTFGLVGWPFSILSYNSPQTTARFYWSCFIHSFFQQIFVEHILNSRHYTWCQATGMRRDRPYPQEVSGPHFELILLEVSSASVLSQHLLHASLWHLHHYL